MLLSGAVFHYAQFGNGEKFVEEGKQRAFRKRILKRAKFSFNNEYCSSECVIRNISETGALIDVGDGRLLPDKFKLHNEMDGYNIECEVARRIGNSAGVRFVGPREPVTPTRSQIITIPRRENFQDPRNVHGTGEAENAESSVNSLGQTAEVFLKKKTVFGRR